MLYIDGGILELTKCKFYLMFMLYDKVQQLSTSRVAKAHSRLAHLSDPAPSLKPSQYRMNLPTQNPIVHLTPQGNLISQSFYLKKISTYLRRYVLIFY